MKSEKMENKRAHRTSALPSQQDAGSPPKMALQDDTLPGYYLGGKELAHVAADTSDLGDMTE